MNSAGKWVELEMTILGTQTQKNKCDMFFSHWKPLAPNLQMRVNNPE